MAKKQKIVTFLWFQTEAEEAAKHYCKIFKRSKITSTMRMTDAATGKKGDVITVEFHIEGQQFVALNGNPHRNFTDAVSLLVNCETQREIDALWKKLLAGGGTETACGWLKDKYGVSWQITPAILLKLLQDKNPKKAGAVMAAMMQMVKLDIAKLKAAYKSA